MSTEIGGSGAGSRTEPMVNVVAAKEALRVRLGDTERERNQLRADLAAAQAEIERLAFDGAINQAMFEMLYRVYPDSPDNHYKSLGLLTRLIADLTDASATIERQNAVIEAAKTLRNHDCGVCATSWCDQRDIRLSNAFDTALAALDAAADGEA